MPKRRFRKNNISIDENVTEIIAALIRLVENNPSHEDEKLFFESIDLSSIAVQSAVPSQNTALHKVLHEIAYYQNVSCFYDEPNWFNSYKEWADNVILTFKAMSKEPPSSFRKVNSRNVFEIRNANRGTFCSGLIEFVKSSFSILWLNKEVLFKFNTLLAQKICSADRSNQSLFDEHGRVKRREIPRWLHNTITKREGGICHYGPHPVSTNFHTDTDGHIDHMVPLCDGGGNDPTNLVLSCDKCNLSKGGRRIPIEDHSYWPEVDSFYQSETDQNR